MVKESRSSAVRRERSTCSGASSSSEAAEVSASVGVAAREEKTEEGPDARFEKVVAGARWEALGVVEPEMLKRNEGGGFEGVVDGVADVKLNDGAVAFSADASLPNLIGVPSLYDWSPAPDFRGDDFVPAAAPKSKCLKGFVGGVDVPLVCPNIGPELLFSFSESAPSSRVMRESRLPFGAVSCFLYRDVSSLDSSASVSDAPNFRLGGVVGSTEPDAWSFCNVSRSSSDSSSWLLEDADERWLKGLPAGDGAALPALNTDPPDDNAGLAAREPKRPGVDAPLAGFERPLKVLEAGVELLPDFASLAKGLAAGVEVVTAGAADLGAGVGASRAFVAAGLVTGIEKPVTTAAASFSLAMRSASFLSYFADHSASVSSSES